ncbi:MAG: AAA family ATPase, partial [Pseudomonas stutzeri]|nr:AAA family ATPase [Stutzerimonas stutzeri]
MPQLRRLFPDIAAPLELPPEQERRYLFNSLQEFIERAGRAQPLLLVLEDLHWADDSTMLLLQHIAQRLQEMPVLIVGTYRDVELDVARPLATGLRELARQRLAHRL